MTGCTIRWLIQELEKCENKDRVVKVFESDFKSRDIEDAGTIREVSGRNDTERPLRIYTFA